MESLLQDMRSFSLLHVQQVVDVLSALLCFALSLAKKHSVVDPLPETVSVSLIEAIDPDQFMKPEEIQLTDIEFDNAAKLRKAVIYTEILNRKY